MAGANSNMHALKTLKRNGLTLACLSRVCRATLVTRLTYCSPAWRGFCTVSQLDQLDAALRRAQRLGLYSKDEPALSDILDAADVRLIGRASSNRHILHSFLPPLKQTSYNLRKRTHSRVLPHKTTGLMKNFIMHSFYTDIY